MNTRRDLDAFGPLDDVDDRRVDEDQRDAARSRATSCARRHAVQRDGERRRAHQHQHAGRVRAALRVDVGLEEDRDEEGDRREDQRPAAGAPCAHSGAMP